MMMRIMAVNLAINGCLPREVTKCDVRGVVTTFNGKLNAAT